MLIVLARDETGRWPDRQLIVPNNRQPILTNDRLSVLSNVRLLVVNRDVVIEPVTAYKIKSIYWTHNVKMPIKTDVYIINL